MLKECKAQCDYLIVGLQTDPSIDRPKKHKPIETIEERMIRLKGCKYVDKVIVYETELDLFNLLKELKPDVRFLGEDWKGKQFTGDTLPIKIIYNSRNHNFSSSYLIERIKNNVY
jgi:glycerol-3-phosphate cytidylyltransferase